MAAPYPFFAGAGFAGAPVAGALAGLACAAPPASGPVGAISALLDREHESLHVHVLVVLLRVLDFNLLEVARPLQRRNEVRDRIDRSRRAFQRQRIPLLRHRGQPQVFRPRNRVRHLVQQLLSTGPVSLQLLDGAYTLLQHQLLLFECFHLLLDLFELGLLRLQHLDSFVLLIQLRLPGMVEIEQEQSAQQHSGPDEYQRHRRSRVHRPSRRFWPCLPQ